MLTHFHDTPVPAQTERLYRKRLAEVYRSRDRLFAWLGLLQLGAAVLITGLSTSPRFGLALGMGGALLAPVLFLMKKRPGAALTRHTIAAAQMLWSGLLIHLSGGRIETHFHVFGSLAFLAFYRDWHVLQTATMTLLLNHSLRAMFLPQSIYGTPGAEGWRVLEHLGWVIFEDLILIMGIREQRAEMKTFAARQATTDRVKADVERHVVERTRELEASREQFRALVENTHAVPWTIDLPNRIVTYIGPQVLEVFGVEPNDVMTAGFFERRLELDDRTRLFEAMTHALEQNTHFTVEVNLRAADARVFAVRLVGNASKSFYGAIQGVAIDVTEVHQLEVELREAQKLESVGRLASGIAHEINTPVQFVSDSLHFLKDALAETMPLIERYRTELAALSNRHEEARLALDSLAKLEDDADLAYLVENAPKAADRMADGLGRVTRLVRSLKEFAHPEQSEKSWADLNHALESTLVIARNEYKYVADVDLELGAVPQVFCQVNELNQVFLNILVNASHAIEEQVKGTPRRGRIGVRTRIEGADVIVSISDTGGGITREVGERIYDPFFTTKPMGRGTGQGLAIARSVVVDKHGGKLWFDTQPGEGTVFHIRIPISDTTAHAAATSSPRPPGARA